ncbi:hypothetical protein [Lactiplantibacillus carotarum]|nr:hypothetical protein [Lactiplantibacillus carotarum]
MMLKPLQKRGWTRPVAAGVLALVIMSMVFTVKGLPLWLPQFINQ